MMNALAAVAIIVAFLFVIPPLIYYVGPLWMRWAKWWADVE